jgi:hypothetical protein
VKFKRVEEAEGRPEDGQGNNHIILFDFHHLKFQQLLLIHEIVQWYRCLYSYLGDG